MAEIDREDAMIIKNRINSKIIIVNDCWEWQGSKDRKNYGRINWKGKNYPAHRLSYKVFVSDFENSLHIDHLCRNHCCVNPSHLEPVTHKENVNRGIVAEVNRKRMLAKTHCKNGHEYGDDVQIGHNPGGRTYRKCPECNRIDARKSRLKKKEVQYE